MPRKPVVCFRERGDAFVGAIEMPLVDGGSITAHSVGFSPFDVLSRAASIAERVATDPALAPLIPPQALLAARTARAITNAGKQNPELLRKVSTEMTPAGKTLSKALLRAEKRRRRRRRERRRGRGEAYDPRAQYADEQPQEDGYGYEQQGYEQPGYDDPQYAEQPGYVEQQATPGAFTPTKEDLAAREIWGESAFAKGAFGDGSAPQVQGVVEWTEEE